MEPNLVQYIPIAVLLGIAVFFAFSVLGKLVVGHWHESQQQTS